MPTTLSRLRKIVREDAIKLGHEVGYLCKQSEGIYTVECICCGMWATIETHTDKIYLDPIKLYNIERGINNNWNNRRVLFYGKCKYISGRTLSDVHPPHSKGTISGDLITRKCDKNITRPCLVH